MRAFRHKTPSEEVNGDDEDGAGVDSAVPASCESGNGAGELPRATDSVYNGAYVPDTDVAKAEATARYVLERAGVHVLWTNRSGQVLSYQHLG